MGEPQTHTQTTLNVEVPAYKYAAPKNILSVILLNLLLIILGMITQILYISEAKLLTIYIISKTCFVESTTLSIAEDQGIGFCICRFLDWEGHSIF